MTNSYLNGKVTVTSLAAPTSEDIRVLNALSDDERTTLLGEHLERSEQSGLSDRSPEEIRDELKAEMRKDGRL